MDLFGGTPNYVRVLLHSCGEVCAKWMSTERRVCTDNGRKCAPDASIIIELVRTRRMPSHNYAYVTKLNI